MSKNKEPKTPQVTPATKTENAKKPGRKISRTKVYVLTLTLLFLALFYLYSSPSKVSNNNAKYVNIESEIYEDSNAQDNSLDITEDITQNDVIFDDEDLSKIVSKQQAQIAKLEKDYNAIIENMEKVEHKNNLPTIILEFVHLENLIRENKDPRAQLQKLEVLIGQDYNLASKVAKLRFFLSNNPKTGARLEEEFANLIPKIIAKKSEIAGDKEWLNNIKSTLSQLVTIRRVDGKIQNPQENTDLILLKAEKLIAKRQYIATLQMLELIDEKYKPLLIGFIFDLKNAQGLKQTNREIYSYLKILSRN